MTSKLRFTITALLWAMLLFAAYSIAVHAQTAIENQKQKKGKGTVTPQACCPLVQGTGTVGQIPKWINFTGTNFVLGDSVMTESNGNIGIGTGSPTSKLTVQGMIETTLGGVKFPDGTVQTSAGLSPGQVVTSLNGLKGDVQLAAGSNISITPNGNTLSISASGLLSGVNHDTTLMGSGAAASPLSVSVPLILSGSPPSIGLFGQAIILATNTSYTAPGVAASGGPGGAGVDSSGGDTNTGTGGGDGVRAKGGRSDSGLGGDGVSAQGGPSSSNSGGNGVFATGGGTGKGNGGNGVFAQGGSGVGAGHSGGIGIEAAGGVGENGATNGLAGKFNGDVQVTGNLSKGGGSFKIDHPLDPENKYLYHSFVESPDMKNIYDGNVVTDENGEATVTLPDWFDALNRDFRYQLTAIGTFAQAIIAEKIKGNRFKVRTSAPGVEVSWQVTGIRQDAWANNHRIQVEVEKPERERGYYLHPEAYDQPEERGVEWARNPLLMKQLKESRAMKEVRNPPRTKPANDN
jgi:hypothetical protein